LNVLERVQLPPEQADALSRVTELPAAPVYVPVDEQPAPRAQDPEPDDETVLPRLPVAEPEREAASAAVAPTRAEMASTATGAANLTKRNIGEILLIVGRRVTAPSRSGCRWSFAVVFQRTAPM
jgi:hypothetical protein